jgi:nucleotide-binding universal stress UspA family protein
MKTILVATDFSPSASNAANYAADMALAIKADLLLLYVYKLPASYEDVGIPFNEGKFIEDAEKRINELKNQLSQRTGGRLNIDTKVRMALSFRQELENVCEDVKPYSVVMGSQGTTATEHLFFGSHAFYAMKHLMWPLIAVPPAVIFSSIKKILLACDYDNVLTTIPLDEIKLLVHDFSAELHVLNTAKNQESNPKVDFETGLLYKMLYPLNPDYHFIASEYTDEAIMNFAEKNDIDLLIVLPKRHDLLDKLIHKSHTKQMVLHCHVPVMALHQ